MALNSRIHPFNNYDKFPLTRIQTKKCSLKFCEKLKCIRNLVAGRSVMHIVMIVKIWRTFLEFRTSKFARFFFGSWSIQDSSLHNVDVIIHT